MDTVGSIIWAAQNLTAVAALKIHARLLRPAEHRGRGAMWTSVPKRFDGLEMGGPHSRVGARKQAYQTT